VGNNFYDPVMHKQFTYADASLSMVSRAGGDGELSKQTTDE